MVTEYDWKRAEEWLRDSGCGEDILPEDYDAVEGSLAEAFARHRTEARPVMKGSRNFTITTQLRISPNGQVEVAEAPTVKRKRG
jgi:hypothetical protein